VDGVVLGVRQWECRQSFDKKARGEGESVGETSFTQQLCPELENRRRRRRIGRESSRGRRQPTGGEQV
jgi:hypothetical protein